MTLFRLTNLKSVMKQDIKIEMSREKSVRLKSLLIRQQQSITAFI